MAWLPSALFCDVRMRRQSATPSASPIDSFSALSSHVAPQYLDKDLLQTERGGGSDLLTTVDLQIIKRQIDR